METAEQVLSNLIVLQILHLASILVKSDSPKEEAVEGFPHTDYGFRTVFVVKYSSNIHVCMRNLVYQLNSLSHAITPVYKYLHNQNHRF